MNWRRWLGIVWVALAGFLAGCGADEPVLDRVPAGGVVVAFGDSLTFGTGAKPAQSYPAILAELSSLTVIRSGVPGELSEAGLARLPGVLAEHQPALVLLCHGGNDLLRRRNLATAQNNLTEMINLIRASGAQVVLLGVPKPGLFLSPAEFYDRVAEDARVVYVRDVIATVLSDGDLKSDTAHPNAAGYEEIARTVYRTLVEAGAW